MCKEASMKRKSAACSLHHVVLSLSFYVFFGLLVVLRGRLSHNSEKNSTLKPTENYTSYAWKVDIFLMFSLPFSALVSELPLRFHLCFGRRHPLHPPLRDAKNSARRQNSAYYMKSLSHGHMAYGKDFFNGGHLKGRNRSWICRVGKRQGRRPEGWDWKKTITQ